MKLIKKISRKIHKVMNKIIDYVKPFISTIKYLDYTLFYSKGTLLMNMFDKESSLYEPETCKILYDLIKGKNSPMFIDIGSNIGLISLYMVKYVPEIQIIAFEPGPHQAILFRKTIASNKLQDKIMLYESALSNKDGEADFYIHSSGYDPGDGLIDTGRYGDTNKIKVHTLKLDTWWVEQSMPKIDLIKIDTEGAELWVLEGAGELIKECRPAIFIEMSLLNYRNYPYSAIDIVLKLIDFRYKIYSESGISVTPENLDQLQKSEVENYYCIPFKL